MQAVMLLVLLTAMADPPTPIPAQMRLKDGTVYQLKEAPQLKDGRFIFTTPDGRMFSLAEKEVDEVRLLIPTPPPRVAPNPQDSRALGAIARQQRRTRGRYTMIAPAPTPRPKKGSSAS